MTDDFAAHLAAVDQTVLAPVVQQLLGQPGIEVLDWERELLHGGVGFWSGVYGVYRFHGTARVGANTVAWTLILKALGAVSEGGSPDPAAWFYWKREALLYQSDLLDSLPAGLRAPRCFAVAEYSPEEIWLWLEEVHEEGARSWPLAQYGIAAQHLGEFNGAYLAGRPLPSQPWLTQGYARKWVILTEPFYSYFNDLPTSCQHPEVQKVMPESSIEGMEALWAQRERLLHTLAQLPRCFCHHDAFRRNLMARRDQEGQAQTVAIDWAVAGAGAVGEEVARLLMTSLAFVEMPISEAPALDATIFAGYVAGLRVAGWQGETKVARLGYTVTALLYGMNQLGFDMQGMHAGMPDAVVEGIFGHSIDRILAQHAGLFRYTITVAGEAQSLLTELMM